MPAIFIIIYGPAQRMLTHAAGRILWALWPIAWRCGKAKQWRSFCCELKKVSLCMYACCGWFMDLRMYVCMYVCMSLMTGFNCVYEIVSQYVCMYVCVPCMICCEHEKVSLCMSLEFFPPVFAWSCMHVCMYECMHVCMHPSRHVRACEMQKICTTTHIYIYIYMHASIHRREDGSLVTGNDGQRTEVTLMVRIFTKDRSSQAASSPGNTTMRTQTHTVICKRMCSRAAAAHQWLGVNGCWSFTVQVVKQGRNQWDARAWMLCLRYVWCPSGSASFVQRHMCAIVWVCVRVCMSRANIWCLDLHH